MSDSYERFVRRSLSADDERELESVDSLAVRLLDYLWTERQLIQGVHIHGASSGAVQKLVARLLRDELGFKQERVIPPEIGFSTLARPDFIYALGPGRGILAEVERGGTTLNNHDLKDMWKAHISPNAQHLFLIVPHANWDAEGRVRERPFIRVKRRMSSFFGDPRREVDVVSAHVFGYGPEVAPNASSTTGPIHSGQ